jgi:predicted SnoaL-like aldol condensation-catalyzing enzyme
VSEEFEKEKEIQMSQVQLETVVQHEVVLAVLAHLQKGEINEATAYFAKKFHFNDHGIELEFTDSGRLADFFKKTRELYPDSSLRTDRVLVTGDYVTIQWMRHTVLTEPFFGGRSRKVPISLHGASIVRIEDGRIKEWSDYYDGLKSQRTAWAGHFTEWIEL